MLRFARSAALGFAVTVAATLGLVAPAQADGPSIAARQCTALYEVASRWSTGFVANITVINTGAEPLDGWTVVVIYPDATTTVTNAWNSTYTQIDNVIIIRSMVWNRTVNGRVTAGFIAAGTNSAPTSVTCIPDSPPSPPHQPTCPGR